MKKALVWGVLVFIVWRVAVQALGTFAERTIIPESGPQVVRPGFDEWLQGDATRYLEISERGYSERDLAPLFPGFPLVVRAVSALGPSALNSALIINLVAGATTAGLIYLLAVQLIGRSGAARAPFYLLLSPGALFIAAPFPEAMFLALAIGSFLAARSGRWWLAGALGAGAAITDIQAIALFPALLVLGLRPQSPPAPSRTPPAPSRTRDSQDFPETPPRARVLSLIPLALIPLTLVGWGAWLSAKGLGFFSFLTELTKPPPPGYLPWFEVFVFVTAVLGVVFADRLLPFECTMYSAVALLIAVGVGGFTGSHREAIAAFPLFIAAARAGDGLFGRVYMTAAGMSLGLVVGLYTTGYWAG